MTVAALTVEIVFKGWLARLLLGPGFADQGNLLIFATLYQLTLVAITLYAYYLLVNRQRRGALLVVAILACSLSLPSLFVSTPLAMIKLLWLSLLAGFGIYWLLLQLKSPDEEA